jgi:hypothetical protein
MENVTLRKKLSTYLSDKGRLSNISEEVLYEVLVSWENWTGTAKDFYRSIGFTHRQMAGIIGKAKKLKREGRFGSSEFKQLSVEGEAVSISTQPTGPCSGAEITWKSGHVIRFAEVSMLIDFLKKSA